MVLYFFYRFCAECLSGWGGYHRLMQGVASDLQLSDDSNSNTGRLVVGLGSPVDHSYGRLRFFDRSIGRFSGESRVG